jgi:hypothetical protein
MRRYYSKKTLAQDRIDLLEKLGFVWDHRSAHWEEMFQKLSVYKEQVSHHIVSSTLLSISLFQMITWLYSTVCLVWSRQSYTCKLQILINGVLSKVASEI